MYGHILYKPSTQSAILGLEGMPLALASDIFTSSDHQIVFAIDASGADSKGNLSLNLQNLDLNSVYKVIVSADSVIDFNFEILEVNTEGTAYPLDGLSVAGQNSFYFNELLTIQFT